MRLTIPSLAILVLAFVPAAHAEPTSIRCADGFNKQTYFLTYDLQTKRLVFESPVGNIHRGEILAANEETLDLILHAIGKLLVSYDRKRNVMYWPGLLASELHREALHHVCKGAPDRTVLSSFDQWPETTDLSRREPIDAFSLRCTGPSAYYFITLDRSTKAVVYQVVRGTGLSGEIKSISGHEIKFTLGFKDQYELVWNEQKRELTWIGIPNNPARPTKTEECTAMKVQSIMELYDLIQR